MNKNKYINSNWFEWLTIILIFGLLSIIVSYIVSFIDTDVTFSLTAYFKSGVLLFFCLGVIGNTLYVNWHGILHLGKFKSILIGSIIPIGIAITTALIFKELQLKNSPNTIKDYHIEIQVIIFLITMTCISIVKRNALAQEFMVEKEIQTNQLNIETQKQILDSFKVELKKYILMDNISSQDNIRFKEALFDLRDKLEDVIKKI